jgi:DNA-binding Xre family transcriptional regulator
MSKDRKYPLKNNNSRLLNVTSYQPEVFLDKIAKKLKINSDRELSRVLGIPSSVVSKIRHKSIPISANHLLAIHDISDLSIKKLRQMMGDNRKLFS